MDEKRITSICTSCGRIYAPKKNGIFEKSMEVARLLLEHEPVSIIAHTV